MKRSTKFCRLEICQREHTKTGDYCERCDRRWKVFMMPPHDEFDPFMLYDYVHPMHPFWIGFQEWVPHPYDFERQIFSPEIELYPQLCHIGGCENRHDTYDNLCVDHLTDLWLAGRYNGQTLEPFDL